MAAPSHTVRTKPSGFYLTDGYKSVVAFSAFPAVQVWEKSVKPSGTQGGEPIPASTMQLDVWHRMAPRSLKKKGPMVMVCAYDPDSKPQIEAMVNSQQSMTQYWPTGDYEDFFGTLNETEYSELKEGEPPEVTLTIIVTNWDPVNNVEAGPVYVAAGGT